MRLIDTEDKEQFLRLLDEELEAKLPPDRARQIIAFAREFFETNPLEEIRSRRLSDVYGAVVACWGFLQDHQPDQPKVRVFNPALETHGWQSSHSVIAILHPNIPFLMDSVRMELNREELAVHTILHGVLCLERDAQGQLVRLIEGRTGACPAQAEALLYFEVDRHGDPAALDRLRETLEGVLAEVRVTVADFEPMRQRVFAAIEELVGAAAELDAAEREESLEFLRWLTDNHFTFLGYDEYERVEDEGSLRLRRKDSSRLGIIRSHEDGSPWVDLEHLPLKARAKTLSPEPLIFAKSAQRSRVHRPAYPDLVAVKRYNAQGEVVGVHRFLGLYTASAYRQSPAQIPFIRRKVARVMERSGLDEYDYAGRELEQLITVYPRDELFQMSADELFEVSLGILNIQERRRIRLFMREDLYGQFVSALVYVPRDIYNTDLRLKMADILTQALDAWDLEFTTYFSESVLARTLFVLRVQPVEQRHLNVRELEYKIQTVAQSWQDGLREALYENHGEELGNRLMRRYQNAFSPSYQDIYSPQRAAIDIDYLTGLENGQRLAMSFYRAIEEDQRVLRLKLYHTGSQLPLSDVLPLFENLGLRVMGEHPFEARDRSGHVVWIHDFSLLTHDSRVIEINEIRHHFEELFTKVWEGDAENDGFNRLVLADGFNWRQIALVRAYARYMRQIRLSYSLDFVANTLVSHVQACRLLVKLFEARFDPDQFQSMGHSAAVQKKLEVELNAALESVDNLSEDRVIRRYADLIRATLRTNFYQRDAEGQLKTYLSFKLCPAEVPEMPLPVPLFEVFVYSPRVEGVHLRGGKVARGGLRWSDRFEDYRTEVLGLVKAQQVKNAVIVPVGAKGGFVAKALPEGDREAWLAEGIASYKTFVRGLLDITDNLKGGEVVPPRDVVRHDGDDTYLVVAADKGTASFSDIANGLSAGYDFWLGDAFASGGSQGYDHKKMGITARGAWVSVERHFREIGINPREQWFTAIGIGDMSGDVFGNGMLLSRHLQLVAAFNHLHIFIDPDPDPALSFEERQRLFNLPRSSWADYDATLISPGGGVFPRTLKSIPISPQMKARFGITQDHLPPAMLVSALLRAPVDLLWNGGIGTYVKASHETHTEVGDKANDVVRVNGRDLGCRVVGEGGNLGMTQLGRVEYALNGGKLNTDFIDNAGGVDCSDHEVNIKILLNELVAEGDLTEKQRNQLLLEMTEAVAELVLQNNYRQTQAISIAEAEAAPRLEEYRRLINDLELSGRLNRALEAIPDDEAITERKSRNQGLTRPELAILFSYVKGLLKERLIESDLPDDDYLAREITTAFPHQLVEHFGDRLLQHRLRREIVATQIANDLVNHMGITFVDRLRQSTGASVPAIAEAYIIVRDVFRLEDRWRDIEALDYRVESQVQLAMMNELARLMRRACRWLLRNRRSELNVSDNMAKFVSGIQQIGSNWPTLLRGAQFEYWNERNQELLAAGVPDSLASMVAASMHLYSALGIIEAQDQTGAPLDRVANLFFALGERLELQWFAEQIDALRPSNHWQALAREAFREDLDWQQRALTVGVLRQADVAADVEACLDVWSERHEDLILRWNSMLTELKAVKVPEFAMFSVALRELLDIAQSTLHTVVSVESSV